MKSHARIPVLLSIAKQLHKPIFRTPCRPYFVPDTCRMNGIGVHSLEPSFILSARCFHHKWKPISTQKQLSPSLSCGFATKKGADGEVNLRHRSMFTTYFCTSRAFSTFRNLSSFKCFSNKTESFNTVNFFLCKSSKSVSTSSAVNVHKQNKSNSIRPASHTLSENASRTSRNHDESKGILSSPRLNKVHERTRQTLKRRVSRLRARMIHHNRFLKDKLSAQRVQGSAVVGKLRKKLLVKKENIKTIPNLLTTLRMGSAPVLAYLVVNNNFGIALGVFLVAGLTDLLDGYIARNFKNQKSALGTALDPLADKLLISFLTVSLTSADLIPLPMTALILSRDAGLILASFYIRYISLAPPKTLSRYFDVSHVTAKLYPSTISKVNTALQLLYVASTLASPVFDCVGHPLLQGLMYMTAGTTFLSGADYMLTWRRRLKIIKNN